MSSYPKSVEGKLSEKSVIECKTVKLKLIDSSYFELGQTKWRTKIKRRLKLFTYISIQLPHNEAKCKAQQQLLNE